DNVRRANGWSIHLSSDCLSPTFQRTISDRLIEDPMSAALADRMQYDFAAQFGKPTVFHPIRARVCDDLIHDWYQRSASSRPVVVALGEGLETQFWRVASSRIRWISVDLPEAIALRKQWLPAHEWMETVEVSALDFAWMDTIPSDARPLISASGLLMYFQPDEVKQLLTEIAARWPGAELFFDTISPWFARKTIRGWKVTSNYSVPPMPWGICVDDLPDLIRAIPNLKPVRIQHYGQPFPRRTRLYNWLGRIGPVRRRFAGSLVHARVRATS
ncbi:MAG: class I SAM-dependent methyltransferase, partial [Pseudomonadota bacterium]